MKTYKFKLPKNMEVKSFNTKVVNGEIVVNVELKERFQPKDGDFCVTNRGCIFIFNANYQFASLSGYYVGIDGADRITINRTNKEGFGGAERFATKSEINTFLERLKKELHKKWNAEKKCLEDIYIPKFGDIVKIDHSDCTRYERNYIIAIVPNKDIPDSKNNDFFDIAFLDMEGGLRLNGTSPYIPDNVYPASEDEKKDLFDKLAEVGKKWNSETKKLEDIRWKPKPGEYFWYITPLGDVAITKYIQGYYRDEELILINNCFRTSEIARIEADKFKELLKNSKAG